MTSLGHGWRRVSLPHGVTFLYKSRRTQTAPKRGDRPRHTHTHTIYTLFDECYSSAPQWLLPLSPVSHRLALASLAVSDPPHPFPPLLPPKSACSSGAGVVAPTVCPPPECGESSTGATACVRGLIIAHGRRIAGSPPPPLGVRVRDRHMQKAGCGREQLP